MTTTATTIGTTVMIMGKPGGSASVTNEIEIAATDGTTESFGTVTEIDIGTITAAISISIDLLSGIVATIVTMIVGTIVTLMSFNYRQAVVKWCIAIASITPAITTTTTPTTKIGEVLS
jgi:hypothetical protein